MYGFFKRSNNERGGSSIEIIVLLSVVILIFGALTVGGKQMVSDVLTEMAGTQTTQAETETAVQQEPVDAFTQLDKDAFVFLGDAGFMTSEEKQVAGTALLGQIELLLTQAETAGMTDAVDMLVDYETKIEAEMNYGI